MTKLTNKAEFIDAAMDWLRDCGFSYGQERADKAEAFWSRLVKRGLAEEQPEAGNYHVKWFADDPWTIGRLTEEGHWLAVGSAAWQRAPAIIGPRIQEPKD